MTSTLLNFYRGQQLRAKPLPQILKHLCANWTYFNHPYTVGSVPISTPDSHLLSLQDKQKYLQSLDQPETSK